MVLNLKLIRHHQVNQPRTATVNVPRSCELRILGAVGGAVLIGLIFYIIMVRRHRKEDIKNAEHALEQRKRAEAGARYEYDEEEDASRPRSAGLGSGWLAAWPKGGASARWRSKTSFAAL